VVVLVDSLQKSLVDAAIAKHARLDSLERFGELVDQSSSSHAGID